MRVRLLLALVAALTIALAAPAAAQNDESEVFVVHGIPGATVDVWVDGEPLLEGFEPGTITDPLSLAPGAYEIEVFEAGADPDESDPLISANPEVPGGANLSVVAHLDADGQPTLTAFANDVSEVSSGSGRLTARHTAAAPEVDVRADGTPLFEGVANGQEGTTEVPTGAYSADVVLAGEDEPVIGPADLDLDEGTVTIAYAIGSADEGTLDLLVQTISPDPDGVPAGLGGLADGQRSLPTWSVLALVLGAALALGSAVRLTRRTA